MHPDRPAPLRPHQILADSLTIRFIQAFEPFPYRLFATVASGGVIHGDHQIPHRVSHPAVGAGILVQHHSRQRRAFAFDAVFAPALGGLDHTSVLQHGFEPAVAAQAFELSLVLAVKVGHVPAVKGFLKSHFAVLLHVAGPA